jgi:hypothetical protein
MVNLDLVVCGRQMALAHGSSDAVASRESPTRDDAADRVGAGPTVAARARPHFRTRPWGPFSASDLSAPERQDGHIVGTDHPKQDEKDRNGMKGPNPESPVSTKETKPSG